MTTNPTRNLVWPASEKALRLLLGTALTLLVARQMGPVEFGVFSTVFAIVMLLSAFSGLGLKDVAIDEIASGRTDTLKVVSNTASLLCLVGISLAFAFVASASWFYDLDNNELWVAVFLSAILAMKGYEAILFGLEANANLRTTAIILNISLIVSAAAKGVVLFIGATAVYLAMAIMIEFFVLFVAAIFLGYSQGSVIHFRAFRLDYTLMLLKRAWPLMVSSFAVLTYFYADQLIIAILMGEEEVGVYAAATRISQQLYMIPTVLVAAYYPRLTSINTRSTDDFNEGFISLAVVLSIIAIGVLVLVLLTGDALLGILLGDQFYVTGSILKLHAFGLLFVSLNIISARWYVMQGLQRLSLLRQVLAAVLNIILNFILIPIMGLHGAVYATLLSLLFLAIGFDFLSLKTRPLAIVKFSALKSVLYPKKVIRSCNILASM